MAAFNATLVTSLSVADCLDRLRAVTKPDGFVKVVSLIGGIFMSERDGAVQLRVQRPLTRNVFARLLYLEFIPHDGGTIVVVKARMHRLVKAMLALWFVGVLGMSLTGTCFTLLHTGHTRAARFFANLALVVLIPLFGAAIVTWGVTDGDRDVRDMVELVKRSLGARETA